MPRWRCSSTKNCNLTKQALPCYWRLKVLDVSFELCRLESELVSSGIMDMGAQSGS